MECCISKIPGSVERDRQNKIVYMCIDSIHVALWL